MSKLLETREQKQITIKPSLIKDSSKFIKDNPKHKSFSRLVEIALTEYMDGYK